MCPPKLLEIVKILEDSAYLTVTPGKFYVFFIFCFYNFSVLENMSNNVRKFRFPCYI